LRGWHVDGVLSTFEHVEPGVDGLFETLRLLTNDVFHHHFVTGASNRKIWFRSHDKSERLKVSGHVKPALPRAAGDNLAQVHRPAFRGDRPQDISEKLTADLGGGLQLG